MQNSEKPWVRICRHRGSDSSSFLFAVSLFAFRRAPSVPKMRIEEDVKLDFKDVLIRPKRSTLKSRSEVELNRTFTFKHSKKSWTGVPIAVAVSRRGGHNTSANELLWGEGGLRAADLAGAEFDILSWRIGVCAAFRIQPAIQRCSDRQSAGQTNQGTNAVAIGYLAGAYSQQYSAVAVGQSAGQTNQGTNAIAVCSNAGKFGQRVNAVAITVLLP